MSTVEHLNGFTSDLAPPTDKKLEIKDKFSLILELLWITLLILPNVLVTIYRTIFPPSGRSLNGQVVLVTGGGRGLGRGLALGFSMEGCKVAVADVNINNAFKTASEISTLGGTAKAYFCNVAKVDNVKALLEAVVSDLGPVDILVNNAGLIYGGQLLEECEEQDIRAVIDVNLLSHFWMMREFLPSMKARNSGHIVAIASISAFVGVESGSAYIAAKFGVRGLMEVVRAELELRYHNNIKTTTVYPYFINTSAEYVDRWDIRFPPMSIEKAVEATIAGVKTDQVTVVIPGYLQPLLHIVRLIPQCMLDRYKKVFFSKMLPYRGEGRRPSLRHQ